MVQLAHLMMLGPMRSMVGLGTAAERRWRSDWRRLVGDFGRSAHDRYVALDASVDETNAGNAQSEAHNSLKRRGRRPGGV